MDIYCEEGTKVKFINKGGRDGETKEASKYLNIEDIYTVDNVDIGGWNSDVTLKEFPDKSFNTVMFEEINKETTINEDVEDLDTIDEIKEFKAYIIGGKAYVVEDSTTMKDPDTHKELEKITVAIEKDLLKFLVTDCGLLEEIGVNASIWSN